MSGGFQGHRPSGKSSYPIVLVAGAEKTGKSYLVAEFSGSDLIGETFWIEFGENTAEQYGGVPGARYIVGDHDGTFNDVCRRTREAVAEPMRDGKPNCIVIDSVSIIWETLSAEAQQIANGRRKVTDVDAESKITPDVWNIVTDRWKKLLRILKSHNGPVILIARLDVVAVMDAAGQPTKEKTQKVKAQKALPYDVDVIVQIPEYRKFQLTGVRSLVLQMPPDEKFDLPGDFTLDGLMRNLGLPADGFTAPRVFVEPVASADDALAEAGPQRPAQRQRPQAPVEDEWSTPRPPAAHPDQVKHILGGMREVRGIRDDAALRTAIEAMVRHEVTDPFTLSAEECAAIAAALTAEQEAKQAAPDGPTPNDPAMAEGKSRAMHGLFREKGIEDRDDKHEFIARVLGHPIETMKNLTRSQGDRIINALNTGEIPPNGVLDDNVAEALTAGIQRAATSDELADVTEAAWQAKAAGTITDARHTALMDQSMAREAELSGQAREAREVVSA